MGMFSKKTTLEFGVSGMTCGNCEAKVTRALLEIRGVKKVVASSSESRITVMAKESQKIRLQRLSEVAALW